MNMDKKLTLLYVAAALTLTGCSSDELVSNTALKSEVAVRPQVKGPTRGESVTLANLDAFRVWAVNEDADNPAIEKNFMDVVTPNDDGTAWKMQSSHYWMTDAVSGTPFYGDNIASFSGIYPKDLVTSEERPVKTDLSLTTANGRELKDILVAYYSGTRDANITSGVPLNFKHVLSQIVIRARNGHTDERKVEIIGVKLVNVKPQGTLTFPRVNTNGTEAYTPISDVTGTPVAYSINHSSQQEIVELTGEAQNLMFDGDAAPGGFMVLPQSFTCADDPYDLTATDTYISVLCRLYKKTAEGTWSLIYPKGNTSGQYAYASVGIAGTWESGKKYIYTLNFYEGSGGAGVIDPNPTDPDNPGDPDDPNNPGNPEVDPTPDDPENPSGVVDDEQSRMPIVFTVTVEDWQEGTGSDFNKILE